MAIERISFFIRSFTIHRFGEGSSDDWIWRQENLNAKAAKTEKENRKV